MEAPVVREAADERFSSPGGSSGEPSFEGGRVDLVSLCCLIGRQEWSFISSNLPEKDYQDTPKVEGYATGKRRVSYQNCYSA